MQSATSTTQRLIVLCAMLIGFVACRESTAPGVKHGVQVAGVAAVRSECEPTVFVCPDSTEYYENAPPPVGGIVVPGYETLSSCITDHGAAGDGDQDGVKDDCEYALAYAFRPLLRQTAYEATMGGLIPGDYYYAVRREGTIFPGGVTMPVLWGYTSIEIAYLPAYYNDLGAVGTAFDGAHEGDSEFLVVDVTFYQGKWAFTRAFTSAHCDATLPVLSFISTQANCQWWNADSWHRPDAGFVDDILNGAPRVWVSTNKHAFYYAWTPCAYAQGTIEACVLPSTDTRFPIEPGYNVGSDAVRWVDSVTRRRMYGEPYDVEYLWSSNVFRGWNSFPWVGDAPKGYGRILREFGF